MNTVPPRRVVLCLDDFGLTPGINRAALELAAAGRLGAISCMVGAPAWAAGAPLLRQLEKGSVDIGLHLDFTDSPLDRTLARPLGPLLARAWLRQLPGARIRREVEAQLDAFTSALGRAPDHVDGHQHVHQLPQVREALLQALGDRGLRSWLRGTRPPPGAGFKAGVIAALGGRGLRRLAAAQGQPVSGRLLGVYDFSGGEPRYRAMLADWLARARGGDVLMCHASADARGAPGDPIAMARWAEYKVLGSPALPGLLAAAGCEIGPWREGLG